VNGACCSTKSRNFTSACRRFDQPSPSRVREEETVARTCVRGKERQERIGKCAARRRDERKEEREREREAKGQRSEPERKTEKETYRVRGKKTEAVRSEKNTERPDPLAPRVFLVIASFSRERERPAAGTKEERRTGVHKRNQRKKRKKQVSRARCRRRDRHLFPRSRRARCRSGESITPPCVTSKSPAGRREKTGRRPGGRREGRTKGGRQAGRQAGLDDPSHRLVVVVVVVAVVVASPRFVSSRPVPSRLVSSRLVSPRLVSRSALSRARLPHKPSRFLRAG